MTENGQRPQQGSPSASKSTNQIRATIRANVLPVIPCWCHKCFHRISLAHARTADVLTWHWVIINVENLHWRRTLLFWVGLDIVNRVERVWVSRSLHVHSVLYRSFFCVCLPSGILWTKMRMSEWSDFREWNIVMFKGPKHRGRTFWQNRISLIWAARSQKGMYNTNPKWKAHIHHSLWAWTTCFCFDVECGLPDRFHHLQITLKCLTVKFCKENNRL